VSAPKADPIYRGWTIPEKYASKLSDLDTCANCGGPKTKHGAMCIACRRAIGRAKRPFSARFWEKVDRGEPDECWPWMGARDPSGYGRFAVGADRSEKASRIAWRLTNGAVPTGLHILHSCDNPPCCNPAHLRPGTHQENMADRVASNRRAGPSQTDRVVAFIRANPGASRMEITQGLAPFVANVTGRVSDARAAGVTVDCRKRTDGRKGYWIVEKAQMELALS
jgi:hypothetical protein